MTIITVNGGMVYETDILIDTENCLYSFEVQNVNDEYSEIKNIIEKKFKF